MAGGEAQYGAEGGDHVDFSSGVFTGPVTGKADIHNHHYYGARRPTAVWPHQVGVIPPRAGCFQTRAEVVRLREALTGGQAAVLVGQDTVRGQVLAGMGGVGKTQLAADYARTAWQAGELDVLVWITASNAIAAASGYAQAAVEILGADPADRETAARTFLAWLEPKANAAPCRWLVVLDDVTDPADLNGLWPPAGPHGRTLVTTRRQDAALSGRLIKVGLFTEAESLAYLTAALGARSRHEPDEQLTALAQDLGHLPLALSQAAAYLIDAGISATAYRRLLADRATLLADTAPEVLPDGQTQSAAAAWSLSVDRADSLRPVGLARPMLQLAAFLSPNGIPETVLTSAPVLAHLAQHRAENGSHTTPQQAPRAEGQDESPASATPEEAAGALRALHRLSLIDHTPASPHEAVRVHQLLQRAVRDTLGPHQHEQTAHTAADALLAAWPNPERDTSLAEALRASTAALTEAAEAALYRTAAYTVLYKAGRSLGRAGQVTAARDYFQQLTQTSRHYLGENHPDTMNARQYLAQWQGEAGDVAGAAAALTDLLADRVRVLGEDHRSTLTTRHYLAQWQAEAGDAAGAAAALTDLLADRVRVLGEDHPDTLVTRHNLARFRGRAGDKAGAAAALTDLLARMVQVMGEDHPDTLVTRHNLAWLLGEAGDAAGAADALTDLLPRMVQVMGEDHPNTLGARHGLANWRGETGDAAGAAAALTDLLPRIVRVMGEDHPNTLTIRHNLAQWQGNAGDAAGAAAALTDLLPHIVRVMGEDHPNTLTTRRSLAYWRGEAGDAAGAAAALTDLLPHIVRVMGEDHPNTLTTRHNLAYWRGEAGGNSRPAR
ncbi:FxSxx-COOH system tetratricopeptide repeat protein [Streptomyces sp. NPDC001816]|uniref:FxSxx-COOH system tetratricopeptide repeat protein n=1 Tax=Streptomyces sp. NPDC001816 TaxID=3364612 RepID=UPI003687EAD7